MTRDNPNTTGELTPREKQELQQEGTRPGRVFRPDIDILEARDGYTIYADLPGVDDESVEVRLENGTLTLDARLATLPESGWTALHTEYRFGGYHREFRIGDGIASESVSAKMKDGVLELHLPKSEARKARTIAVNAA